MQNKTGIRFWGWVLSWLALTRFRWLENVAQGFLNLSVLPIILCGMFVVDVQERLQDALHHSFVYQGDWPSFLLRRFAASKFGLFGMRVLANWYKCIRLVRFALYALITCLTLPLIWLSLGTFKVSWMSVFKLMAIDHTSRKREHRSAYTRFAKIALTHQLERHRLSDWERLFIDGELSKLQKSLYGKKALSTDDKFIKDGPESALVWIEETYARLHEDSSAAPYRTSGVRIPIVFDDVEAEFDDRGAVKVKREA